VKPRSSHRKRRESHAPALPPDFVAAAADWLGDEAAAFLDACARSPRLAIRANGLRGGLVALRAALDDATGEQPVVPWWPGALLPPADEAARLASGRLARIGALYAQDPAALAAVAVLDPRPGERVLDLCAAPGGKSTAIADRLSAAGLLVANDVDAGRARALAWTLERWGVANGATLSLTPDALASLAPRQFDGVLVDAPCSGEAMFARHERAAADWSPAHMRGCAARQQPLLEAARRLTRAGGRIVYSTCTFNPIENEGVVAAYLTAHPDDSLDDAGAYAPDASPGRPDLLPDTLSRPDLARCARLWPHRVTGAGHFVARIRVAGEPPVTSVTRRREKARVPSHKGPMDEADITGVRALVARIAPDAWTAREIAVRGDRAFLAPDGLPADLLPAAFAPGIIVAERRGHTWRPAHGLAMALRPRSVASARHLDDPGAAAFLAGQPIADPSPHGEQGIALAAWRGYPLGWGRARGGILAPLLPKGLLAPQPLPSAYPAAT